MSKWLTYVKPEGSCLIWSRSFNSDGYARAGVKGNTNIKVHREVFFDTHGYYPPVVRHLCDNRQCINPDHLEAGTNLDNIKDRVGRGRSYNQVTTSDYQKCEALRETGLTYKQISQIIEMKPKRVEYILMRWRKESY